jgi:hypothetical protein
MSIKALVRSTHQQSLAQGSLQRVDDISNCSGRAEHPPGPDSEDVDVVAGWLGERERYIWIKIACSPSRKRKFNTSIIVVDYTNSLFRVTGIANATHSRTGTGPSYRTGRFSTLAVIVESVHEAYAAMDRSLRPEERQVARSNYQCQR